MATRFFQHFPLLLFIFIAMNLQAQNTYKVQIQIPDSMEGNKFSITLDDGIETHSIADSFINNQLEFTGEYFSELATLKLLYQVNNSISFEHSYFIGKEPVTVIFKESKLPGQEDPFQNYDIKNAFDIFESDIWSRRNKFSEMEINDMNIFYEKDGHRIDQVDSIRRLYYTKIGNLNKKDLEFIKINKNEYFSFWYFRNYIVPTTLMMIKYDSAKLLNLISVFYTVFPAEFKESIEGKAILEKITGRLTVRKNIGAPDFETKDIHGETLKLSSLRGKYILLDFWATWCGPCMKQIPFLKTLWDEYSKGSLVIISVSADVNYKKFSQVIQDKKMNWIHVYDSKYLPQLYGVTEYPTLILIDDKGKILYDGKEESQEVLVKLLKEMSN